MKTSIKKNRENLKNLLDNITASNSKGESFSLEDAFEKSISMIIEQAKIGGKFFFIGNGGSASIASHMAADFLKNAGISAMAFNDSSSITCISNDLGYKYVFAKPIEMLAETRDVLIAISSSGKSDNILLGVESARAKNASVITLSGFDKGNPLRKMGKINFYVPSSSYGHVEIAHLSICHCLVDMVIGTKNG
jgi:D-sedoheptulose 7-phosphate isomerase